jgi:hypothetical protein
VAVAGAEDNDAASVIFTSASAAATPRPTSLAGVHRPVPPHQPHERSSPAPIRRPPGKDTTANRCGHLPIYGARSKSPFPDTPRAPPNPMMPRRIPQAQGRRKPYSTSWRPVAANMHTRAQYYSPPKAWPLLFEMSPSPPRGLLEIQIRRPPQDLRLKGHARL